MAVNKVVFEDKTLIDLTADTVTSATLLSGYKAHDKSGNLITGTLIDEDNLERYGLVQLNTASAIRIRMSNTNPDIAINISQQGTTNASDITINFRIQRYNTVATSGNFDVYLNNERWVLNSAVATTTSGGINISVVKVGEHFRFTLLNLSSLEVGITLHFVKN